MNTQIKQLGRGKQRHKKHMEYIPENKNQASNDVSKIMARKDLTTLWEVGFSVYHLKMLI